MFLALAALTLSFRLVSGVPVVTVHTDAQMLEMIVDTGASATMFTQRVTSIRRRVCFKDLDYCVSSLIPVETQNLFFEQRKDKKPRIDGVLGRDVLSKFGEVSIDYKRKTVTFGQPAQHRKIHPR